MKKKTKQIIPYIIILNMRDNVATALKGITSGNYALVYDGKKSILTVKKYIKPGFKIALTKIKSGNRIYKYGQAIGLAKSDIEVGEQVHINNMKSLIKNG